MRDLNINELELVYGAGSKGHSGYGSSPTPPRASNSRGKGSKNKGKKSKNKKSKGRGSRPWRAGAVRTRRD